MARPGETSEIASLQRIIMEALEERRGLIAYSRMQAVEMDRLARDYERRALGRIRGELEQMARTGAGLSVHHRLLRMEEELSTLKDQADIGEESRRLEEDEITWRAFEDVAVLLGVEA